MHLPICQDRIDFHYIRLVYKCKYTVYKANLATCNLIWVILARIEPVKRIGIR